MLSTVFQLMLYSFAKIAYEYLPDIYLLTISVLDSFVNVLNFCPFVAIIKIHLPSEMYFIIFLLSLFFINVYFKGCISILTFLSFIVVCYCKFHHSEFILMQDNYMYSHLMYGYLMNKCMWLLQYSYTLFHFLFHHLDMNNLLLRNNYMLYYLMFLHLGNYNHNHLLHSIYLNPNHSDNHMGHHVHKSSYHNTIHHFQHQSNTVHQNTTYNTT